MVIITVDPGHGGRSPFWEHRECLQCSKWFQVRTCYTKRGQGKCCSTSCGTTYRNLTANPARSPAVREKIKANHADVSGAKNPMYGVKGAAAPGYIDGRHSFSDRPYRGMVLVNNPLKCEVCHEQPSAMHKLHVHHKDQNRTNNSLENLQLVCVNCHNNVFHSKVRDALGRFTQREVM